MCRLNSFLCVPSKFFLSKINKKKNIYFFCLERLLHQIIIQIITFSVPIWKQDLWDTAWATCGICKCGPCPLLRCGWPWFVCMPFAILICPPPREAQVETQEGGWDPSYSLTPRHTGECRGTLENVSTSVSSTSLGGSPWSSSFELGAGRAARSRGGV